MKLKRILMSSFVFSVGLLILSTVFYLWFLWNEGSVSAFGLHSYQFSGICVVILGFVSATVFLFGTVYIHIYKRE